MLFISTLILSCGALTPVSPNADDVLLRYKFQAGQKLSYETNVSMDMQMESQGKTTPMQTMAKMKSFQTIRSVDQDGTATLDVEVHQLGSTLNGVETKPDPAAVPLKSSIRMSNVGKVDRIDIPIKGPGGLDLNNMQISGQLPAAAVHPGSEWQSAVNMPKMGDIVLKNTLVKVETVSGKTLAYIDSTGTLDMGKLMAAMQLGPGLTAKGSMMFDLVTVVNLGEGCMESTSMKSTYNLTMNKDTNTSPGPDMVMKGIQKMTQTRLPAN